MIILILETLCCCDLYECMFNSTVKLQINQLLSDLILSILFNAIHGLGGSIDSDQNWSLLEPPAPLYSGDVFVFIILYYDALGER